MRPSLYYQFKSWEHKRRYRVWESRGKPLPPPHFVKQLTIKEFARRFSSHVLVETGTYHGEMVSAMAGGFEQIYSIEVDEALFRAAREKFRRRSHIRLLRGDSAMELPKVLADVREPAIFWLDGHYTGVHAGKTDLNTPILLELAAIAAHAVKQHVILIDDARLFTGRDDYPSMESLREAAARLFPSACFEVADDVIRIYPCATAP
ncbi:MAG: hypothetical protein ABI651_09445 [Verrucomicrobiota bacterium]